MLELSCVSLSLCDSVTRDTCLPMPSEESVVTGSLWHILKTAGWKINTPRHMFPEDVHELE